jgi:hypothetical protein
MYTRSVLSAILTVTTTTKTLPFFIEGGMRMREYQVRTGRDMTEHAVKTQRPRVPVHIGKVIPICILFEQPFCAYFPYFYPYPFLSCLFCSSLPFIFIPVAILSGFLPPFCSFFHGLKKVRVKMDDGRKRGVMERSREE